MSEPSFKQQVADRIKRLILTMVGKKWVVYFSACGLLWAGKIDPMTWWLCCGLVVGADTWQKIAKVPR